MHKLFFREIIFTKKFHEIDLTEKKPLAYINASDFFRIRYKAFLHFFLWCGRSREDAFGAKQHDFLWRLIEESNPLLWRYYSYFRFFFFFGNYSFFFLYKNCRQFFFFKHFNGFEFWFKFRSYFFRTGISLLGVWDFFPAILKRKKNFV